MEIVFSNHALERLTERGADKFEVEETILKGESFEGKYGRKTYKKNFPFERERNGKFYKVKQIEVIVAMEVNQIVVITVIVKYF